MTNYVCGVVHVNPCPLPTTASPGAQGDERLLKLYETGLPTWAVFLPQYGLFYRPWLRTAVWLLFMAVSIFSLACGFYDLYKNVPYLRKVSMASRCREIKCMWVPPVLLCGPHCGQFAGDFMRLR